MSLEYLSVFKCLSSALFCFLLMLPLIHLAVLIESSKTERRLKMDHGRAH